MIKHKPTPNQLRSHPDAQPHVHLMIHTFEGDRFTRVNDWQDQTQAEALTREIEKKWQLYQLAPSREAEYSAPTTGQKRRMMREQQEFEAGWRDAPSQEPTKQQLERLVVKACGSRPELPTFIDRLQHQGVDVHPTIIGGEMKGFAFEYQGFRCRGSSLKNCSWKKLREVRGLSYNPTRDLPILRAVAAGERVSLEQPQSPSNRLSQSNSLQPERSIEAEGTAQQAVSPPQKRQSPRRFSKGRQKQLEL